MYSRDFGIILLSYATTTLKVAKLSLLVITTLLSPEVEQLRTKRSTQNSIEICKGSLSNVLRTACAEKHRRLCILSSLKQTKNTDNRLQSPDTRTPAPKTTHQIKPDVDLQGRTNAKQLSKKGGRSTDQLHKLLRLSTSRKMKQKALAKLKNPAASLLLCLERAVNNSFNMLWYNGIQNGNI